MFRRLLNPFKKNSFFLFGARATGKSTLIQHLLGEEKVLLLNLLDPAEYEEATLRLDDLAARLEAASFAYEWVFIDEVQKAPRVLDVVQKLIDRKVCRFILTGSSARKLKRGGANLLAGRAYTFQLFPLTSIELGKEFDLNTHLAFGGLPTIWNLKANDEREIYLRSYVSTYLKEEIAEEQVVRKLEPFGRFLQVAAQSSGQLINYSSIARDVGTSDQSIKTYFQILEDTLVGSVLYPFHESVRKTQGRSPKFYFFDTGILRALRREVTQPLSEQTYNYGNLFEHFVIHEIQRRAAYAGKEFDYSFLRTADQQEIDLIIDRPGKKRAVIEIKSTKNIRETDLATITRVGSDIRRSDLFCLSRDSNPKQFGHVRALPWAQGIEEIIG